MDGNGWTALCDAKSRHALLYNRFRDRGFPHQRMCSLVAGDSRVTGREASSAQAYAAHEANELLHDVSAGEEMSVDREEQPESRVSVASTKTTLELFSPPSADERTACVKRLRDGRNKASHNLLTDEINASINVFMQKKAQYFQLKTS